MNLLKLLRTLLLLLTLPATGCSVLLGNIRPVEERAALPAEANAPNLLPQPWLGVTNQGEGRTETPKPTEPEFNFQNQETGSTIAYTSGCRHSYLTSTPQLRRIAEALGSGLTQIERRQQSEILISGIPALQTTLSGRAAGSAVVIHNVLLATSGCIHDVTLVSLQRHFQSDRTAFDKLLATLPFPK